MLCSVVLKKPSIGVVHPFRKSYKPFLRFRVWQSTLRNIIHCNKYLTVTSFGRSGCHCKITQKSGHATLRGTSETLTSKNHVTRTSDTKVDSFGLNVSVFCFGHVWPKQNTETFDFWLFAAARPGYSSIQFKNTWTSLYSRHTQMHTHTPPPSRIPLSLIC